MSHDDTEIISVEDMPRARFKDVGEAYEHLQAKKSGEPEPDFATRDVEQATRDTHADVGAAHDHLVQEDQDRRAEQQREADETAAREQAHATGLRNLSAKGKAHAEALETHIPAMQAAAQEFRQQVAAAQQLTDPGQRQLALAALQERGQAYASWANDARTSKLEAEKGRMVELRPQLGTKEGRATLAKWAEGKGYTKAQIQNASLQQVISAYDVMRAEEGAVQTHQQQKASQERAAKLSRPRRSLHTGAHFSAAGPAPAEMTPSEAKERLRRTGGMRDAINAWTLLREQERERNG